MGMFDYLVCKAKLPGEPPEFVKEPGHQFQTKSLDCCLATIEITEDGFLTGYPDYHGIVTFYDGNSGACGYGFHFTKHGEDYEWVEYSAGFSLGKLQAIVETVRRSEPALPIAELNAVSPLHKPPDREAIKAHQERIAKSYTGHELWYARGGRTASEGYKVKVLAEDDKKLVLQSDKNGIELEYRRFIGSILFDSMEQAIEHEEASKSDDEAIKAKFAAMLANRKIPS